MTTTVVMVSGMVCDGCASKVKKALEEIDGVSHAEVALASGRVEVTSTENAQTNLAEFQNTIEALGFDVVT